MRDYDQWYEGPWEHDRRVQREVQQPDENHRLTADRVCGICGELGHERSCKGCGSVAVRIP